MIGLAASLSLLAGWRLYATIAAAGLAMRFDLINTPQHLQALDVLANPWVIGVAGFIAIVELFADKVIWLDSVWDAVHTLIRPLGGAMIALAVVDAQDPAWQVVAFLLGGGAALISHGAKAGVRAAVNTSPEPVSNIAVSAAEDAITLGGLWLALSNPIAAIVVAVVFFAAVVALCVFAWRVVSRLTRKPAETRG
jgi:hypothetical protein